MKTNRTHTLITASLILWTGAALAGTWTYDNTNNRISHSDTGWVLNVNRSDTNLTVTSVSAKPPAPSALPLSDTVTGHAITAIGTGAFLTVPT